MKLFHIISHVSGAVLVYVIVLTSSRKFDPFKFGSEASSVRVAEGACKSRHLRFSLYR